jgi:hypothetical protein
MENHSDELPVEPSAGEMTENEIDEVLEDSFPASDPPPWTLGVDPHVHDGNDEE